MYCSSDQCVLKQMYSLKEIRPSQSCSIRKMFSLGYGANARNITICLIQPCLKLSERYRTRITQANFINDFQILSLLVVNTSDSMLHPISFRSSLSPQGSSLHPNHLLFGCSQEQRLVLREQDA